jgi:hypothetical protein
MNTKKWLIAGGVTTLVLLATLALATGLTRAQEPEPRAERNGESGAEEAAAVDNVIPIQGRLTDASGNPIDGDRTIIFTLYDQSTGGTALCQDEDSVHVDNGLFTGFIDYCTSSDIDGKRLYLGIQVAGDEEMTPRREIYPVPYAFSLLPGAVISDTHDGTLTVRSTGSGDGDALLAYAGDEGEAVTATSVNGIGVAAFSDSFVGLQAYSHDPDDDHPGVFGCAAPSNSACDPYRDDSGAGVMGYSQHDFGGYFVSGTDADGGVYAEANFNLGTAIWADNNGGGIGVYAEGDAPGGTAHNLPTLYLVQLDATGDYVVGARSLWGTHDWRVDRTGRGFFNGGTQSSGADFAEQMAVEGEEAGYEPGDVLVISTSADQMVELSAEPFSTAVIGVYSTEPAVLAGAPDTDDPLEGIPVAITGIVPCKVSAENGSIQRGDLLVTASTPGHAMRAGDNPPQGTVLGKALGELKDGTGIIQVLVTLQ